MSSELRTEGEVKTSGNQVSRVLESGHGSETDSSLKAVELLERDDGSSGLPESGSALLSHDLSNYFQKGINTVVKEGESVEEFNGSVHFGRSDSTEIDTGGWGERGEDLTYDRSDIREAYCELRENPTSESALEVLEEAAEDGLPQIAGEVVYRTKQVAKAAKGYEEIRKSPRFDEAVLSDAVWAFDKFHEIDFSIEEGLSQDHTVYGNDALNFLSSTLVQNAYEKGVHESTEVEVSRNNEGNVEVVYESQTNEESLEDLGDQIFDYDPSTEGGFGIPASKYILEEFGGSMNYEGQDDIFRLRYTLISKE